MNGTGSRVPKVDEKGVYVANAPRLLWEVVTMLINITMLLEDAGAYAGHVDMADGTVEAHPEDGSIV